MIKSFNANENNIDKASKLRETDIFKHKDFKVNKIRLVIAYKDKFPIKNSNKKPYQIFWLKGQKAEHYILSSKSSIFLGLSNGNFYFSICVNKPEYSEDMYYDLRTLNPLLDNNDLALLTNSRGLSYWHNKNKFCGICGHETKMTDYGHARICVNKACKNKSFPRLDPAVIMLITYQDYCLLGRQKVWPIGMHSTLAGFVEHGETIEQAVARETFEETGVKIRNIQYKYSQPWPFPSSLMLGFHAEAYDKKLHVDYSELEKAEWFSKEYIKDSPENEIFKLPGKISIARRLITDWINN